MRKKVSFYKLIRLWGIIFLTALAGVIVGIDLLTTDHDFNIRIDNMRTDYVEQQKLASKREVERIVNMINDERTQSESLTRGKIKSRVYEAHSIAQNIYQRNKTTKSDAEIQQMIIDALRPIRFEHGSGYYFANRLDGVVLLIADKPEMEGLNLLDVQDTRGQYIIKDTIEIAVQSGEGFYEYHWTKPQSTGSGFKKISFIKRFEPYDFFLGAGLYVDDIEEQIKATWMERINNIRFDKNLVGYLFAGDWSGKSLAHGAQPDLIGKNLWEWEDSRGNKTSQLIIAASKKKDGGYANFWWRKPDTGKESPKIAYAKSVPEWELFVASGVYTDDLDQNIAILQAVLNTQTKTKVLISIIIVAIAFAVFIVLFNFLSNRLRKDLNLFVSFLDQAAFSDEKVDRETVQFVELDQMAESANKMLTDRKRAKEKLHLIIETSPIGICTVDKLGNFITTNLAYERMVGYSKEELRGLSFFDVTHTDDRPKNKTLFQDMFSLETTSFSMEKRYIRKDGAEINVVVSATGIRGVDGNPSFGTAFVEDVTERKQSDEELKKSEERFRLLVENAPDAIFVTDKSCFSYLNSAALRLFGANFDHDLIGTPIIERYHPKVRDAIRERMQAIIEQNIAVPLNQSICLQLDGTEVDVESVAVPMNFEGESGGLVFVRNITDRVIDQKRQQQLEEQLHQSQKIESLGRLAGGVAHDYNNMLSVILGYSELAQMKVDPSEPIQNDLEQIQNAAIRSRDITQQLLAFARKQIISPKVLDMNAAVENTLKMLRNLLGENIDLVWQPRENLWPIKIDPSQLDQILANLCVNARDAITDIGKMTIETDAVSHEQDYCDDHLGIQPGDFVVLAVSDNGCGMDRETANKIFEPFYTTKGIGAGTGLGLATVYGIVKQSEGFINVISEPDQGTTFKIYLPRCEGEGVVVKEVTTSQIQKGQGETVLLVEDEIAIVQLATAMLEELGYKVLAANSPTEALSVAEVYQGEIQLLLTDVVMPDMNGRDLAKQVQEMYPEVKTLFMSGYTANVIAHHGVLDEGINFIQKPFSRSDLSIRIREALGSNS